MNEGVIRKTRSAPVGTILAPRLGRGMGNAGNRRYYLVATSRRHRYRAQDPLRLGRLHRCQSRRFERELRRSRYLGRFLIIVEGSLGDVATASRGIHSSAVLGTVAAWSARYCPIIFAGSVPAAAAIAFSALRSQIRDFERTAAKLNHDTP